MLVLLLSRNEMLAVIERMHAAAPDVLLMQETKLHDADVPADVFERAGYALAHYLLNEGFGVVGIEGLKVEPLSKRMRQAFVEEFARRGGIAIWPKARAALIAAALNTT